MEPASGRKQERASLLIVDDQPNNIKVLFDFLVQNGHRVLVAQDGESALEKAAKAGPDLILLDVMMPGIDGFETCRQLKAQEKTKDIPVIFMTALSDTPFSVKGFEVGAVDYVTKPIQQEEILARVRTHLTIRKMHVELQEKTRILNEKVRQLEREVLKREQLEAELMKTNQMLHSLATVDSLTQVPNRRCFDDFLKREWLRAIRAGERLAMIMCDIDYFKRYNDRYGHLEGDECLRTVARTIASAAKRTTDMVARYGGEEFAVLLPNTGREGALGVAEEIQRALADAAIPHEDSDTGVFVTLSLGVATVVPTKESDPNLLLDTADRALYQAKDRGRHCIVSEGADA